MTITAPDVDAIEDLDFTVAIPCEHSQHLSKHAGNEPAAYIVRVECHACDDVACRALCRPGLVIYATAATVLCNQCRVPNRFTYTIVEELR